MRTTASKRLASIENPSPEEQQRAYQEELRRTSAERRGALASGDRPSYYHREIARLYRLLVPENASVLVLGSGNGGLLRALRPAVGVGVDIDPEAVAAARAAHPDLRFETVEAYEDLGELALALAPGAEHRAVSGSAVTAAGSTVAPRSLEAAAPTESSRGQEAPRGPVFDFVLLPDLLVDCWDVQAVFAELRRFCHPGTRVIANSYSRLWQVPLSVARKLKLARPRLGRSWLDPHDVRNLLALEGFECFRTMNEVLCPLPIPLVDRIMNRGLAKLWPLRWFCLTNFFIARPAPAPSPRPLTVSVVVPARNEAGNIRRICEEIPDLGAGTEIIFVEGSSTDDTWETLERTIPEFAHRDIKLLKQPGKGKGDAVRHAYARANGDILMILDADLTVPAADLRRFYDAIALGRGEFINGVRLVYPMQDDAMRFLNLVANKFFALAFSWVLGQPIKDTLCGTKVMTRRNYERLAANRAYFGEFDPFGDFDLIFGAAKLNLRIIDLPIRYQNRVYGTTNISRWRHGVLLLRMLALATRRLKFV